MDPMTGSWSIHEACTLVEPPHDEDYVNECGRLHHGQGGGSSRVR